MTNRDAKWRETATDSELHGHVVRTIERLRDHAKMAQDVVGYDMSPDHVLVLLDALDKSTDELALRTDDRELMDAARPTKPEPNCDPIAKPSHWRYAGTHIDSSVRS